MTALVIERALDALLQDYKLLSLKTQYYYWVERIVQEGLQLGPLIVVKRRA